MLLSSVLFRVGNITRCAESATRLLAQARNNDQANWVHFGFGIWEPDDPDQTNQEDLDFLEPEETYTEVCEDDEARVFHQKGNCYSNTCVKLRRVAYF